MQQTPRSRLIAGIVALLILTGIAAASLVAVAPPAVVPATAPADGFSADRAFAHVERIGQRVHPVGSAAANDVRDYIVSTLTGIGLQPAIQDAVGGTADLGDVYGMAQVQNVVAVLPGVASTGRVFMVAHYDSVQVSFGGNDDGAGVSTLLETARALAAGPRQQNDIVFVFTDGEEACICGSEAFVDLNPLAASGGVVLNFESRGSGGPAVMFETSAGNAAVVEVYAAAVPYPVATSFAVEVYRLLPNDTDFTPFRVTGRFTGLNTAYIDGSAVYHAPEDKPAYMDTSSLQQHGSNALALALAFGAADIATLAAPGVDDSSYFPALGILVRYPGWLVWPIAVVAVLAVLALAVVARRRGVVSWPRLAAGFALAFLPLALAPVAAQLLWSLLVVLRPGYANMMDPWWPGWFRACVVAMVATILLTWYGLLRRRIGPLALAIGGLGWLALLGVVLAAVAPGGSYLAALPALAGAAGGIVAVWFSRWWVRLGAMTVAGAVAVVILVPTVFLFFPALGLETGAAAALFAVILGLALLPLVEQLYPALADSGYASRSGDTEPESAQRVSPDEPVRPVRAAEIEPAQRVSADKPVNPVPGTSHRRWAAAPALTAGVLTVAFLVTGLAVDRFDATHPVPTQLAYALDTDTGQARWVSSDVDPGEWISQYVGVREDLNAAFGLFGDGVETGPAQPADLPPPRLTVVSDGTAGARRLLTFKVTPQRSARLVYVELPDAIVLRATVNGREVPPEQLPGRFGVVFHAPPADGVTFALELVSPLPTTLRVMDGSDGLAGLPGFVPRPDGVGIRGSHTSELVVVAKTYTV